MTANRPTTAKPAPPRRRTPDALEAEAKDALRTVLISIVLIAAVAALPAAVFGG